MAFGQELKDFVNGFTTGYKLIDSPEEKEWKREERQMKREDHQYRRDRDKIGDDQWNKSDNFRERNLDWQMNNAERNFQRARDRDAAADEQNAETTRHNRVKERYLEHKYKQGLQGAPNDRERMDDFDKFEPDTGIPDGSEQNSYEGSALEPASYGGGDIRSMYGSYEPKNGQEIAYNLVMDLQDDYGMGQEEAIGLVGQLAHETVGFKHMQEIKPMVEGSRGGGGYAMWTGPRRKAFEAFVGDGDTNSYAQNYAFLRHELDNTPEGRVLASLRGKDALGAGRAFTDGFLRPGIPGYGSRDAWTMRVKSLFDGGAKKGKAINAAVGGMVTAIPDDGEEVTTEVTQALPEDVPTPTPRPDYGGEGAIDDGQASGEADDKPTDDPYETARRAIREGLNRAIDQADAQVDAVLDDPEVQKNQERLLRGYGAAPSEMVRMMMQKIDPEGKMAPNERNTLAMANAYRFFWDRGEPEKAKEAAMSLVQYYNVTSQKFLALAQAAAENGDVDNAVKATVAAYANVPNGRDLSVVANEDGTYTVNVTDLKSGKQIVKQVVPPDQMLAQVMQFSPKTFYDELLNAAGAPAEEVKMSDSERGDTLEDTIGGNVTDMPSAGGEPMSEGSTKGIRNIARGLAMVEGNNLGPGEAADVATRLLQFDANDPENDAANFSAKPKRANPDMYEITVDGKKYDIPTNQYRELMNLRGTMTEDRTAGRAEEKADGEWWKNWRDNVGKFASSFADAATDDAGSVADTVRGVVPVPTGSSVGGMVGRGAVRLFQGDEGEAQASDGGAIPDGEPTPANMKEIERLLRIREDYLKDPERYDLKGIEERLRQLGWKGE